MFPASFQQRWIFTESARQSQWSCAVGHALWLLGALDVRALQASIEYLVQNHEALRTVIRTVDGEPRQVVYEPCDYELRGVFIDNEFDSVSKATRYVELFLSGEFDGRDESLFGARLLRFSKERHVLVTSFSRLIADCHAIKQFFDELWVAYGNLLSRSIMSAAIPASQYSVYATWQHETTSAWVAKHESYWRTRLAGADRVTFPIDKYAASLLDAQIVEQQFQLDATLSSALLEVARRKKTLPALVMLTLCVCALARWCRQLDLVIPFNIAGRRMEHERVFGNFTHALFLRIQLSKQDSFTDVLRRAGLSFFQALSHDDLGRLMKERPELLAGAFFQWLPDEPYNHQFRQPYAVRDELLVQRLDIRNTERLTTMPPGVAGLEITMFNSAHGIGMTTLHPQTRLSPEAVSRFVQMLVRIAQTFVESPESPAII